MSPKGVRTIPFGGDDGAVPIAGSASERGVLVDAATVGVGPIARAVGCRVGCTVPVVGLAGGTTLATGVDLAGLGVAVGVGDAGRGLGTDEV
jgi:hypothetical protein